MPALPEWFQRLPEIIAAFEGLRLTNVGCPVFEELFGVSHRRAYQLMHEVGGAQVGNAYVVKRAAVLKYLHAMRSDFTLESERKAHVAAELEESRRLARGRKILIDAAPDVRERVMAELPAGIQIRPGELRIEFAGVADLLRQLFELSQALNNDYDRVAAACGEPVANGMAAAGA
jgi:hypothetical protein